MSCRVGDFRVIAACVFALGISACGGGGGGGNPDTTNNQPLPSVAPFPADTPREPANEPMVELDTETEPVVVEPPAEPAEPTAPATPPVTTQASVLLTWQAPAMNTNGTVLMDLAGYRINYGVEPNALTTTVQLGADVTSTMIGGLDPGTYYFAIKAVNAAGEESMLVGPVSKTIN